MTGVAFLRDVCLDANDPAMVGAFWGAVLGRRAEDAGEGDGSTRDVVLRGDPTIWVNGVAEPKQGKVRIHLDVELHRSSGVDDLVALGARVLHLPLSLGPAQAWWVLCDPEGHEFCAFAAEPEPADQGDEPYDNDADVEVSGAGSPG